MKRTKTRKFAAAVAAALVVASVATPALAGNNVDTSFYFHFKHTDSTQGTEYRAKRDAAPVYVGIGYKDVRGVDLFVDAPGGRNVTVHGRAPLLRTGQFAIRTNAYEWGYRSVRLTAMSRDGGGELSGFWSPDSMRWYPRLN